jgi:hypothetical protein
VHIFGRIQADNRIEISSQRRRNEAMVWCAPKFPTEHWKESANELINTSPAQLKTAEHDRDVSGLLYFLHNLKLVEERVDADGL